MKVQQKIFEEQLKIFSETGTYDNVKRSHIAEMKYLECCIKESLRLYPPVSFIGREAEAKTEIDGFVVDKGKTILVDIYHLHRNPDVWENPNEFIPERFSEGR